MIYIITESEPYPAPSASIQLKLEPREALRLATNILSGMQANLQYGLSQPIRVGFTGTVTTRRDKTDAD